MTYGVVPRKLCALLRKQMTVHLDGGGRHQRYKPWRKAIKKIHKSLKYGIFLGRYRAAFVL